MLSQHFTTPSPRTRSGKRPGLSPAPSASRVVLIKDGLVLPGARRKRPLRKLSA